VAYATLAAIAILTLSHVDSSIVAILAVVGLGAILFMSRAFARKTGPQLPQDETGRDSRLPVFHPTAGGVAAAPPISGRELEVLALVAGGKSNKEIAAALAISEQTVKNHISHIFAKIEVSDRTSAVLKAIDLGWIEARVSEETPEGNVD
jgi:DNA-binding NarL/FixJ family response regulator